MGISISLAGELPQTDIATILGLARAALTLPPPLDRLREVKEYKNGAEFRLLPFAAPGWMRIEPAQPAARRLRMVVEFETSGVGPGYHGAVIDGLYRLAEKGGFAWRLSDGDDEGQFYAAENVKALQSEHRRHLALIAEQIVHYIDQGMADILVAMPIEASFATPADRPVATNLGLRSRAFFAAPEAADFYPWWDQGLGPAAGIGLATALLWVAFPWAAPLGGRDRIVGEVALALIESAAAAGARQPPPAAPAEIRALLDSTALIVPSPEGIGYRRLTWRQPLDNRWSVQVPGWFRRETDDRGASVFVFGRREVNIHQFEGDHVPNARERERTLAFFTAEITREEGGLVGRAHVRLGDPAHGEAGGWALHGAVVDGKGIALIMIFFPTPEHRPWAEATFRSVAPPR